MKWPFVR